MKLHSGDSKKCDTLQEAHARLSTYIKFNIDYKDKEHLQKLDAETASGAWLEAYTEHMNVKEKGDKIVAKLDKK